MSCRAALNTGMPQITSGLSVSRRFEATTTGAAIRRPVRAGDIAQAGRDDFTFAGIEEQPERFALGAAGCGADALRVEQLAGLGRPGIGILIVGRADEPLLAGPSGFMIQMSWLPDWLL